MMLGRVLCLSLPFLCCSLACLESKGKMLSPGGEVLPGGTAHDLLFSGLGGICCNKWQASRGLLLFRYVSWHSWGCWQSLTWPWGEDSHVRWVQLPGSQCSKAGGLYESVLHEMNANSRGDRGIPMSNRQVGTCPMLLCRCSRS